MGRTILIIEDEIIIAENMRLMIGEMPEYEMPDIACTASEAEKFLSTHTPDLILLDIRLGKDQDGIDFAEILSQKHIPFIFVTSHGDSLTVKRAISKEPLGYIIKPVNQQNLHSQLELAFSKLKTKHMYAFRSGHHDIKIPQSQIIFLKSDNVYTDLHTKEERYIIRKSTKSILEELDIDLVQVHRSYFVNPDFIMEANAVLKLSSGQVLPFSRTYKPEVIRAIFGRS